MQRGNTVYPIIYAAFIAAVVIFSVADPAVLQNEEFLQIFSKFTFTVPVLFVIAAFLAFRIDEGRIALVSMTILVLSLLYPLYGLSGGAENGGIITAGFKKLLAGGFPGEVSPRLLLLLSLSLSLIFFVPGRAGRSSLLWLKLVLLIVPFLFVLVPRLEVLELWKDYRIGPFLFAWPALIAAVLPAGFSFLYKSRRSLIFAPAFSAVLFFLIIPALFPLNRFFNEICRLLSGIILLHSLYRAYWESSYIDELTGLFNRRALDERLRRLRRNYTLAMVDVDHFKNFNDTYGHDEGDNVLRLVASILYNNFRNSAYRYGGEEFCIIFSRKSPADAAESMNDARTEIEEHGFSIRQNVKNRKKSGRKKTQRRVKKVRLTVSAGISTPSDSVRDAADVLKIADQALYKAKEGGRNRVELLKPR